MELHCTDINKIKVQSNNNKKTERQKENNNRKRKRKKERILPDINVKKMERNEHTRIKDDMFLTNDKL